MKRPMRACARGVVTLEMLLVLMPVMVMFFAVTQAAFLSVAQLVVRHASQRGARAAIVVLEDDPAQYDGEPRGRIRHEDASTNASTSATTAAANMAGDLADMLKSLVSRERSRLNDIRTAVYLPMALIGPAITRPGAAASSLGAALDGPLSHLAGGIFYNLVATAVTFPQAPGSDHERTADYGPNDDVTVRVTYLFKCEVPIAAALMCDPLYELSTGAPLNDVGSGVSSVFGGDARGAVNSARRAQQVRLRLEGQGQAMRELEHGEQPQLQALLMLGKGRFTTIRAETTLPIQGATYYAREQ